MRDKKPKKQPMALKRRSILQGGAALFGALPLASCAPQLMRTARIPEVEVAVIGAGFAGLHATRLLRDAGIETVLLEGGERVGGRVYTLNDLPGAPEAGAEEIGHSYKELLQLFEEFSIPVLRRSRFRPEFCLMVRGQLLSIKSWPFSAANRLSAAEHDILPWRLMSHYLRDPLPVDSLDFWGDPAHAAVDIPLADQLRRAGASEEALRLIDANLNGQGTERLSLADVLRGRLLWRRETEPDALYIQGGLNQISTALAERAGDSLHLQRAVRDIQAEHNLFHLRCSDGSQFRARVVISAIPFSALRNMHVDVPLGPAKKELIERLHYTPVTRVLMEVEREFWEEDGMPANMWTDTPLGRIFALPAGENQRRLMAFSMSGSAEQLDREIDADPHAPLQWMEKIRPASKNALTIERVVSWGRDPLFRGAFSHYDAGDVSRYAASAALPEGRLLFAGEHTEGREAGMEAALLSGRRCAQEALQILSGS